MRHDSAEQADMGAIVLKWIRRAFLAIFVSLGGLIALGIGLAAITGDIPERPSRGARTTQTTVTAPAVSQAPVLRPPLRFDPPLQPVNDADIRGLPPQRQTALRAMNAMCLRWQAAGTRDEQLRIEQDEAAPLVQTLAQTGGQWAGVIIDRAVSNDRGSATVAIGAGVVLATAGTGLLSFDPDDTRMIRGSQAFAGLLDAARADIVTVQADLLYFIPQDGYCSVRSRFRRLVSIGASR